MRGDLLWPTVSGTSGFNHRNQDQPEKATPSHSTSRWRCGTIHFDMFSCLHKSTFPELLPKKSCNEKELKVTIEHWEFEGCCHGSCFFDYLGSAVCFFSLSHRSLIWFTSAGEEQKTWVWHCHISSWLQQAKLSTKHLIFLLFSEWVLLSVKSIKFDNLSTDYRCTEHADFSE